MRKSMSLVIRKTADTKAHQILSRDRWRGQYGYIGLPSRKVFTFRSDVDLVEIKGEFKKAGIKFCEWNGEGYIPHP